MSAQSPTLFEHFGIEAAACAGASTRPKWIAQQWPRSDGSCWLVHSQYEPHAPRPNSIRDGIGMQWWLKWFEPAAVRLVPPTKSAFVSARALTFFGSTARLHRAATRLRYQDILFVGDVLTLSRADLTQRLGSYADCARLMEDRLMVVGLALNARLPWWRRPSDFYR